MKLWDLLGYFQRTSSKRPTRVLAKNLHSMANCVGDTCMSPILPWWLHAKPSKFDLVPISVMNWVKLRKICMELSEHNWADISKAICTGMLIFGKWAFWMLFFHNTPKNRIISQIDFLWCHSLGLYRSACIVFPINMYM